MMESHLYWAKVGLICQGDSVEGTPLFWRTKTLRSDALDSMKLHDADDGSVLWRAELWQKERAVPSATTGSGGHQGLEYLTVIRLYLEDDSSPQLLLVHRDTQPDGLAARASAKTISVFTCDPSSSPESAQPQAMGASALGSGVGASVGGVASSGGLDSRTAGGPSFEQIRACLDPDAPAPESAVFQLTLNEKRSAITLSSVSAPEGAGGVGADRMGVPQRPNMHTLALMTRTAGWGSKSGVAIDSGLDLPLVMMLFCSIEQLLLSSDGDDDVEYADAEPSFSAIEYTTSRSAQYERANAVFAGSFSERLPAQPSADNLPTADPSGRASRADQVVATRPSCFWDLVSDMACFRS